MGVVLEKCVGLNFVVFVFDWLFVMVVGFVFVLWLCFVLVGFGVMICVLLVVSVYFLIILFVNWVGCEWEL